MSDIERQLWEIRLEWAEQSDHPLATSLRLAARMALETTDEHQDRPRRQILQSLGEDEG